MTNIIDRYEDTLKVEPKPYWKNPYYHGYQAGMGMPMVGNPQQVQQGPNGLYPTSTVPNYFPFISLVSF